MSVVGFNSFGPAEVKTTSINGTGTSFTIASAVTGKRIVVVAAALSSGTAGSVAFKSGATEIGPINLAANAPAVLQWNPDGWLVTNTGESLTLANASGLALKGWVRYVVT